jgi:sugar/nucleoside kinase (ribokinase family)
MDVRIAFLGHLSLDVNVIKGQAQHAVGGGVFYGGVTASRLNATTRVYTKCAPTDRERFDVLKDSGIDVVFLPSRTSTSIENNYPTDNPDDRKSRLLSRAEPFTTHDLDQVDTDLLLVNPLWRGEFPDDLIAYAKTRARTLGADAQGFLRTVAPDGRMDQPDWPHKERYLHYFDFLKVDHVEAKVLTGEDDYRTAAKTLLSWGVRQVILTQKSGVSVFVGERVFEASFGPYPIEGRTGRGDTCTAAYVVASVDHEPAEAVAIAARVTTEKMQYRGPYRGPNARPN